MSLSGKKIILGITGGIAAYKAVLLLRLLKKNDCDVTVVMTGEAEKFITPLTLQALSGKPVLRDIFSDPAMFPGKTCARLQPVKQVFSPCP